MKGVNVKLLVMSESTTGKQPLDKRIMKRCLVETLLTGGAAPGSYEISLNLVDDGEMRRLNHEHRGLNRTTDVLSFPQYESFDEIMPGPDGDTILGDIVISLETLDRRCRMRGEDRGHEMVGLLVHGALHLIGYDHSAVSARREMRRLEDRVVDTILDKAL